MRILQICNKAPYPANDGSSIAIYNMSRGFIENGAELHLLTINTKKHYKPDNEIPEDFKRQSNYVSVYRNTDVHAWGAIFNLFGSQSYFVSRFYFPEFEDRLTDLLQKYDFDWVQLEGLFMGNYIPAIRKFSKAKIAIRTHNIEHLIWERMIAHERNPLKKNYLNIQNSRLKAFELQTLPQADAVVTITEYDKHYFQELGIKTAYFVSPTGILLDRYVQKPELEEPFSVFHFGSMDWMPNVEAVDWFLKEVWKPYFENLPQYTFYIAGRNMPPHLLASSYQNVKILPDVPDNIAFYNSKQIMLVPLLSGSGMRIKIIEGMAMGKAIISTTIGAEGIPVSPGKNIMLADTAADFARNIKELCNNASLRTELQKNARIFISEKFNNQNLLAALINFYRSL